MSLLRTIFVLVALSSCTGYPAGRSALTSQIPQKVVWAWERPEDLRFLDKNVGVAYLAQTLVLKDDSVITTRRKQPLKINPEAFLIAVTRIETDRSRGRSPKLSKDQANSITKAVLETLETGPVKGIQIDFDAVRSERNFYAELLRDLRAGLREGVPLSITALASWCMDDRWLSDVPVDEVVPMVFDMGTDDQRIRRFLEAGKDWKEERCKESYGVAIYEKHPIALNPERRTYYFNNRSWDAAQTAKFN